MFALNGSAAPLRQICAPQARRAVNETGTDVVHIQSEQLLIGKRCEMSLPVGFQSNIEKVPIQDACGMKNVAARHDQLALSVWLGFYRVRFNCTNFDTTGYSGCF